MSYDKFRNISIQQLEGLVALAESGNFTKAAGKLFITQSALTKQIMIMEDSAGTKLVNRSSGGAALTPEGRVLYDYAKRIIGLREDARDRIERLKNQESGHVYVSASNIPASYILPKLLTDLNRAHPDIHVHMQMHDSEEALQIILNSQAEIGFIGKEISNRKITAKRLWKDQLVLIVPGDHPHAKRPTVTVEELAKTPLVIREQGSGTRHIIEECLQKKFGSGLSQFNIVCEMGSSESVKEAVLAGLGVSIMSVFSIKRELEQGLLTAVEITGCQMERYFYLIYRKDFPLRRHHLCFLNVVNNYRPFPNTPWKSPILPLPQSNNHQE
jgi:DNA-binding transcriptional LysR family regulator